nr:insulinase family protein [uncultured Marinifilum sp.]
MRKTLLLISALLISAGIFAQKQVPLDPKVKKGTLKNGMTYYIRSNQMPKERADFYIVHNVGASLETDAQNGLAHFCEHMAFNGTKNFPKKGVLNFLERIGVKFGHNVNAFTSTDVTCYNLSDVPLTKPEYVDSALLVLHDWSNYVSFESEEIDAERGVIHEEWRSRRNADFRMSKATMPVIYKDSKYAERDVIGELDVIDNCSYETMRSFYRDWYRPDLQAIIIVGDFDAEKMEKKVVDLFSKIPAAVNPKERTLFELPDNKEPLIAIATDKEARNAQIRVMYKNDVVPPEKKDISYLRYLYIQNLIEMMLGDRFSEKTQSENPPYVYAFGYYGDMVRTKSAFTTVSVAKLDNIDLGLISLLDENERIKRYGFVSSELDRAKADLLSRLEKAFNDRDKQKNESYVWEYFENFLTNEPIPGVEMEYQIAQMLLPAIKVDEVNAKIQSWIHDDNMLVSITGPEKDGVVYPTKEKVAEYILESRKKDIKAYKDNVSNEPLIAKAPKAGKVIDSSLNKELDATIWKLENGLKVIIKKTDFKDDEIMMKAYSYGGSSLYPAEYMPSADLLGVIVGESGLASFDKTSLQKKLAGKVASVSPYVSELKEGFDGRSSVKDFETLLQLTNLYFTNPRFDESTYKGVMSRYAAVIQNKSANPMSCFGDSIRTVMADYNPRVKPMNKELLKKVEFSKIREIYKDRFADASDFTFIFVGNIDAEVAKPMIETYLGSLPSINRKEDFKDNGVRPPYRIVDRDIFMDMEIPKASVYVSFVGEAKYNCNTRLCLEAISHILDLRYTEEIREKEGGTYGVSTWEDFDKIPYEGYSMNMYFDCDPDKVEKLKSLLYSEIEKLKKDGPSDVDLDKARKYFQKSREENLHKNKFWINALEHNCIYNENIVAPKNYDEIVKSLTGKMIQKTANKIFDNNQHVEIIMKPKKS